MSAEAAAKVIDATKFMLAVADTTVRAQAPTLGSAGGGLSSNAVEGIIRRLVEAGILTGVNVDDLRDLLRTDWVVAYLVIFAVHLPHTGYGVRVFVV